ncbi:acetoin utilization protein AcuC [Dehalococcoidia bacterium]|nr:acetoin utilization protein AcuC [Dehalococcoidia bacterium]
MKPYRLKYTYELLNAYGAFNGTNSLLLPPRNATTEELELVHTREYISAVKNLSMNGDSAISHQFGFSTLGDNPVYERMYDSALLSTGSTMFAAKLISENQVDRVFNISGGLHHAAPDHASGFCIFNDPALAIKFLLNSGKRVAYIDIDAHHGDGVQNAFYDNDQVLTISLHESGQYLFPGTGFVKESGQPPGVGYAVNIPLFPYTGDDIYVETFKSVVLPLIRAFGPDVLVTQLGVDSYHTDPLTHLQLTTRGFLDVIQLFSDMKLPWLALGGGGYDVGAVARCWSLAYGQMIGLTLPNNIPTDLVKFTGTDQLRDSIIPTVPSDIQQECENTARLNVEDIKANIFPIFGLD